MVRTGDVMVFFRGPRGPACGPVTPKNCGFMRTHADNDQAVKACHIPSDGGKKPLFPGIAPTLTYKSEKGRAPAAAPGALPVRRCALMRFPYEEWALRHSRTLAGASALPPHLPAHRPVQGMTRL